MKQTEAPPASAHDLHVLYELSLSIGNSLDSRASCQAFLATLMERKPLDLASVWVRASHVAGDSEDGYRLLYHLPASVDGDERLPADHPITEALADVGATSRGASDPGFEDFVTGEGFKSGRYAVFRLGDLGFLKLHSTVAESAVEQDELEQLSTVIAKFSIALEGCLAHERLVREVADRQRAEQALQGSEDRFRHLYDDNPSMYFTLDSDGTVVSVNEFGATQLGYTVTELIDRPVLEVFHDDDREAVQHQLAVALDHPGEVFRWSFRKVRKDGAVIWVEEYARALDDRVLIVCQDITEQKRSESERRRLREQIQEAQKMESLGVLAGGVAHDFNNLLTGVLGNAELAMLDSPPSSPARSYLANIEKAALRAADLCKQLLAYSGKGKFVVQPVCVNAVIREMSDLFQISVTSRVTVKYSLDDDVTWIDGDPTQIAQIVLNLVTNAAEAIGEGQGTITIETGLRECTRDDLLASHIGEGLDPGGYVSVRIADTGVGMDDETIQRIFDPFFTTKFTGRGLGLAAVLGIVRGHGGTLQVRSTPDSGSEFEVLIPSAPLETVEPGEAPSADVEWTSDGRVLLVDDEETALDVGRAILGRLGFQVVVARDGGEALERFSDDPGGFKLVLLDMTMPVMDGSATFKALRAVRPDVPVILCSGYNERETADRFVGPGLDGFLNKPYQIREIRGTVRRVFEERGLA